MHTVESIRGLLAINDRAVERALVILLSRQTADEQSQGETNVSNGMGFSAFHAKTGTYMANYILGLARYASSDDIQRACILYLSSAPGTVGKRLSGRFVVKGRSCAAFHARQLVEVANMRSAATDKVA